MARAAVRAIVGVMPAAAPPATKTLPRAPGLPLLGSLVDIARRTNFVAITDIVRRYGTPVEIGLGALRFVPLARPEHVQHVLVEGRGV